LQSAINFLHAEIFFFLAAFFSGKEEQARCQPVVDAAVIRWFSSFLA
jgi:hypothetical protein